MMKLGSRKKFGSKGFSMIELLVVLLIIGVLAAIAAPMFLGNADKAKASEAVSALGAIRGAERMLKSQNGSYLEVTTSVYDFQTQLGVDIHGAKYFSAHAYTVDTTSPAFADTTLTPTALDFVITADGNNSVDLATNSTAGARNADEVKGASRIQAQMDNSGRIVYKIGDGNWAAY